MKAGSSPLAGAAQGAVLSGPARLLQGLQAQSKRAALEREKDEEGKRFVHAIRSGMPVRRTPAREQVLNKGWKATLDALKTAEADLAEARQATDAARRLGSITLETLERERDALRKVRDLRRSLHQGDIACLGQIDSVPDGGLSLIGSDGREHPVFDMEGVAAVREQLASDILFDHKFYNSQLAALETGIKAASEPS